VYFVGCAAWEMVGGRYDAREFAYHVELPSGWRKHNLSRDSVVLTRDGLLLQRIDILRMPIDKSLANTKRKLVKGMVPLEVAEIVLDEFRSNQSKLNLQLVESVPALVGGYPGFRVIYSYQLNDNLRRKALYYGVLVDQWYYSLSFHAPARHYFDRHVNDFEQVQRSFKITL
jgi:hypothetical protein